MSEFSALRTWRPKAGGSRVLTTKGVDKLCAFSIENLASIFFVNVDMWRKMEPSGDQVSFSSLSTPGILIKDVEEDGPGVASSGDLLPMAALCFPAAVNRELSGDCALNSS